jgi:hypothetical protein
MTGHVDRALDDLFDRLAGTGGAGRRALAEAEDHLRSEVTEGLARGLTPDAAEQEAVERFGRVDRIAVQLRFADVGLGSLLRPVFIGTWLVGAIGLLAIGLSAAVAELMGRAFGAEFVAGDQEGVTYTTERCAEYFEYVPRATTCASAAAMHHWGEVVDYRAAAGVLGLFALVALALARRWILRGAQWAPSRSAVAIVVLALMGVAGGLLGSFSVLQLIFGDASGVGANLSAALIAGAVALAAAAWAVRERISTRAVGRG